MMLSPAMPSRRFSPMYALATSGAVAVWMPLVSAFSFNINSPPQQCSNLSISITGSGGTPPYRALILPSGNSPLPNEIEARTIVDQPFDGDSTSVSFKLKYPALSQFIVVVSDSKTFGSGGTSGAAIVTNSSDATCFDPKTNVQPNFFYNLEPANQIVQCTSTRIWWDPSLVKGNPTIYGVIPGGESFNIPYSSTTTVANQGVGFNWTPKLRTGTTVFLGAGDDRGLGSGGSVSYIVSAGTNPSTGCLDNSSPSSTAGSPAGGSYPTSTEEAESSKNGGGSNSNAGPIAGGVVAGVAVICAFILVLIFFRRRKRFHNQHSKERTDLFTDNEWPDSAREGEIAHLAAPEPYIVPTEPAHSEVGSTVPGSHYGYGVGNGAGGLRPSTERRMSTVSASTDGDLLRPNTPGTSTSGAGTSAWGGMSNASRKTPQGPTLRPVNIIQHEDAGAPDEPEGEETVELPPAYTNLRREER